MIFYFVQLTYLLYIGNNLLQSILANQVMKNSYMETVKEMIHEIRIECPACGADQKSQIKESSNIFGINSKNNSQFISKILKHEAHSRV
jgi:soluble P-type ATPase